jgi:hypothetical protein
MPQHDDRASPTNVFVNACAGAGKTTSASGNDVPVIMASNGKTATIRFLSSWRR